MKKINKKSLERIMGGFSAWAALGITAVVVFLAGTINGVVHPNKCE